MEEKHPDNSKKLIKYQDPGEICNIQPRTSTEIYCEQSAAINNINKISILGSVIATDSRHAIAMGAQILGKQDVAQAIRNVGISTAAGFAAGEITAEAQSAILAMQGLQIIGQTLSVAGPVALAAYIGYKLYDGLQDNFAQVTCYNMFEWARVRIGFSVPTRPNPKGIC